MTELTVNEKAPDFVLASTSTGELKLSSFKGQWVVLYFYPKDCTSGCTLESQDFRDAKNKFAKLNAVILGVSRDNLRSHQKFIEKESLNFELLTDTDEKVCTMYGVMKDKIMYGKKCRGIERSTFLIDPKGVIRAVWRKVKVDGHVGDVLGALKKISTT